MLRRSRVCRKKKVPSDSLATPAEKLVLASEIIKGRERLGLTQAQLSAQSNVSLSAIKSYETGRTQPGARELKQLCLTLQVTPNKLLFGAETLFAERQQEDLAAGPGSKGVAVQRGRIAILAQMLSYDESYAVYSIVHSIALARHGGAEVAEALEMADLATGIGEMKEGGSGFDSELFRLVLKDPEIAIQFGKALKEAATAASDYTPKNSKKVLKK